MFLKISERGKRLVAPSGCGPSGGVTKISQMPLETLLTEASVRTKIVNTENEVDTLQISLVTLTIYVEFERNLLLLSFADAVPSG